MAEVRTLNRAHSDAITALLQAERFHHVFLEHRLNTAELDSPWFGGNIFGFFDSGELIAGLYLSSNVVPFGAYNEEISQAWVSLLRSRSRSSLVGRSDVIADLWSGLEKYWPTPRSLRLNQPLLAIGQPCTIPPDTRVRRILLDELDLVYPSFVAMFQEEVGVNPEMHGKDAYRSRVAGLIAQGWAFGLFMDGQLVFKAEVGAATSSAAQVQGVYVDPAYRGLSLAAPAMAAVIGQIQESIAPWITLYVNDYNHVALNLYRKLGMQQIGTLATVYV